MKKYQNFIILWVCLTLFFSCPFMGIIIIYSALFSIIFLLRRLYRVLFKKASRNDFLIVLSIILSAHIIMSGVHYLRLEYSRHKANIILNQVLEYKSKHGVYPDNSVIQYDNQSIFSGGIDYFKDKEKEEPSLSYIDTFMIFNFYFYDFKESKWNHGE